MAFFGEQGFLKTYAETGRGDRYRMWRKAGLCAVLSIVAIVPYAQSAPSGGADTSILARAAQTVGIRQCFPAIDRVSSRVLADIQEQDAVLGWNHLKPDNAPVFSLPGFQHH